MKLRWLSALAALGLSASQASATTYIYTGNPASSGNHISATVDLNCAGPCAAGSYIFSSGITSFSLTEYSSTNAPLLTLSPNTVGVTMNGNVQYLTLNGAGQVTNWSLFLYLSNFPVANSLITTMGNDFFPPSNTLSGTQDLGFTYNFQIQDYDYYDFIGRAGSWSVAPQASVPEPATWAMIVLGFAGVGAMSWRRSRRAGAALAAR